MCKLILIIQIISTILLEIQGYGTLFDPKNCQISPELKKEIQSYAPTVNKIISEVTQGQFKGTTYQRLADFVDAFGGRFSGTKSLEESIDYVLEKSKEFHLENVHGEDVHFKGWVRGEESAEMIEPRREKLHILSEVNSVGTNGSRLQAEVVVFGSIAEMLTRHKEVKGKIVVYNLNYTNLFEEVAESGREFYETMRFQPVAVVSKSFTSMSLNTPHTGQVNYPEVPCIEMSIEDVEMLNRIQERKQKIVVSLKMDPHFIENAKSRNAVAEMKGREMPEKIVIVSGHIDSLDVGTGAVDDGSGAFLSWNSAVILKALGLIPRRTLRVVFWTAEEMRYIGAVQYLKRNEKELKNVEVAMESDYGVFNPLGLDFGGSVEGACVMHEIVQLFKSLNATKIRHANSVGSDIHLFSNEGIPTVELYSSNENYFHYQHSEGDTMDALDSGEMDRATALWASTAYILADLTRGIPRQKLG